MVMDQDNQQQALFFTQERQQRLDLVTHLIPNSRQPILLRGPEASGKSFFIGQFVKQAPKGWLVFTLETDELAISALDSIELAVNAVQETDKAIQSRLSAWSNQEKVVVAIIEDAHLLSSDCFEQLFQLTGEYSCLRLLISSSENLGDSVEGRCQLIDLEPFTQKQTIEYAKARISSKGLDFVNLAGIDDAVLFIETGGLPGHINDVLDQMQFKPLQNEEAKKRSNKPFFLSAIAISIALAIFLTYGLWGDSNIAEQPVLALPLESGLLPDAVVKEGPLVDEAETEEQTSVSAKRVMIKDEGNRAEVTAVKEQKVKKPLAPLVEPLLPVIEEVVNQVEPAEVVTSISAPPEPEAKVIRKILKKTPLALHHEWLKAQSPNSYTLQLMGVSQEQSIKEYIASKKDVKGLRYFRHKRNNGAWYTVVYGIYANKDLAEAAAKSLPKQLKNIKPWVRRIGSVNEDMFQ